LSEPKKLRVGVVGAGAFAEACHLPGLLSHAGAEVVAIAGRGAERLGRARALASKFGVREVATSGLELCSRDDLDAVTIATPNDSHAELALAAFAAGKHVFCEKPLGLSVAQAEAMARAARRAGRVAMVSFTYRHLYGVEELARRLRAGEIGEPFLFRAHHEFWDGLRGDAEIGWRERRAPSGGGVLHDSGSHFFDLARFLVGDEIVRTKGVTQHLPRRRRAAGSGEVVEVETDDVAAAWFRFARGCRGQWLTSRITPPRGDNFVQVVGSEGALEALLSRGRLDALRIARPGGRGWEELPLAAAASDGESHALWRMMRSFVDACRRGALAPGDASFEDGLAAQRLIAATEDSLDRGWVEVRAGV